MTAKLEQNKVAAKYAKALFDASLEAGVEKKVTEDLKKLSSLFETLPEFFQFMSSPAIPVDEKHTFIQSQFEGKVTQQVYNLLRLMEENDRLSSFIQVQEKFQALRDEYLGVATAEVVTATELTSALEKKLQKSLVKLSGLNEVILNKRVDPGILGGVIIKIQDKVIDGSFVGKLEALRKHIG
jgi:F-type H+-transporting ATPase subunit delta